MKSLFRILIASIALGGLMIGILVYAFSEDGDSKPDWADYITVQRIQSVDDVEGSWALNGWHGYMGTALQLKNGVFHYWFYSDVVSGDEPEYPISGRYRIRRGQLVLEDVEGLRDLRWVLGTYGNEDGLWQDSSLDALIRRGENPDVRMLKRISVNINPSKPVLNTGSSPRTRAQQIDDGNSVKPPGDERTP